MRRRDFFAAAGAGLVGAGVSVAATGQETVARGDAAAGDYASVVARARNLSSAP
jgi:hypothetical protein